MLIAPSVISPLQIEFSKFLKHLGHWEGRVANLISLDL
jgi:hypothetical protein